MVVEKAVADGLGLEIDVKNSQGVLVVNVGYETTEISILSLGGIVLSRLIKTGGHIYLQPCAYRHSFCQMVHLGSSSGEEDPVAVNVCGQLRVRAAVRKEFSLIIGGKTAESVKISLKELDENGTGAVVYGRDIVGTAI